MYIPNMDGYNSIRQNCYILPQDLTAFPEQAAYSSTLSYNLQSPMILTWDHTAAANCLVCRNFQTPINMPWFYFLESNFTAASQTSLNIVSTQVYVWTIFHMKILQSVLTIFAHLYNQSSIWLD